MQTASSTYEKGTPRTESRIVCGACGSTRAEIFFRCDRVPANSCLLLATPAEARGCRRGEIALAGCADCGFVFNAAFDPRLTEYSPLYEETQGFSPTFRRFQEQLASMLVEKYRLRGRTVLEIGCGKGEFLSLLCTLGGNRGIGFDPSYIPERQPAGGDLEVIRDFYSERYVDRGADFICCKMTLEHIHNPLQLVRTVRAALAGRPDAVVFFQVPDAGRILRETAFEDVYYEHCNYFTPDSLANLFRRSGFEIIAAESVYGGQYLTLEARPTESTKAAIEVSESLLLNDFAERYRQRTAAWRRRLKEWQAAGGRTVLWGSGSKAVAFLAAVAPSAPVAAVVDINPHRHGYYMAGNGEPIVAPEALGKIRPSSVVIMNSCYRQEIAEMLRRLNLEPAIWTV